MTSEQQIVSFGSANIYQSDVELLNRGKWLNDRILTFISEYLMHRNSEMYIFSPCETEIIKMAPSSEFVKEMFGLIEFENKKNILFVLNDNENTEVANCGTHWSLLVFNRKRNSFVHFDPLSTPSLRNTEWAKRVYFNTKELFSAETAKFEELYCPKQMNSYDCGLFVAEFMVDVGNNENLDNIVNLNATMITQKRGFWKNLILEFAN